MDSVTLTSSLWSPNTTVRLLNVPWDSQYRDVVAWDSAESRDAWFTSKILSDKTHAWTNTKMRYIRPGEPINVPVPYSTAYKYNYAVVSNPQQPVDMEGAKKDYFYFIINTEYVTPSNTRLTLQLDVMTTYGVDVTLGNMYVERGHIGVSNTNLKVEGNRLNNYATLPEGLDIGSQYTTVWEETKSFMSAKGSDYVLITSTADLTADPGTTSNPKLSTATGNEFGNLPAGASTYLMLASDLSSLMRAAQEYSWVTQCIIGLQAYPAKFATNVKFNASLFGKGTIQLATKCDVETTAAGFYYKDLNEVFKDIYGNLTWMKKLFCYPYSVIELTAWNGTSVFLKPELLKGLVLSIYELACPTPGFTRIVVFPMNYNAADTAHSQTITFGQLRTGESTKAEIFSGDFLDSALTLADFPSFALVNNSYTTYLASTAHSRTYSYDSAGWANAKSNAAARLSYDNTKTQQAYQTAQQAVSQNLAQQQNIASAAQSGIGVAGNLLSGNIGGAVSGALNTAINYEMGNRQIAANQQNFTLGQNATSAVADANLQYAQYAAQGDYANQIAGINATVQDAALSTPSQVGQQGGEGFNWAMGLFGVTIRVKTIAGDSFYAVVNYFARYGYKINRFINLSGKRLADLKVMEHASYWKCAETVLTCALANETEKNAIRGVLEKGVTIWDAPESIGNTDFVNGNKPLYNISY
jgi:hypothetical protein